MLETTEAIRNVVIVATSGFVSGFASMKIADLAWPPDDRWKLQGNELRLALCIALSSAFALLYATHKFDILFWKYCVFGLAMFIVAYINQTTTMVPNLLTMPLIGVGLLQSAITPPGLLSSLIAATGAGIGLWLVAWVYYVLTRTEGFGMGIVKLVAAIGAWLGWQLGAVAVILGLFAGAIAGQVIVARRPGTTEIPAGIYLAVSAVAATLFGQSIFEWYMRFL